MGVSIGIKALNEERHIAAAIESALAVVSRLGGEVILADSGSQDATTDIARRYDIRVLQLAFPEERCCGAGAQLAFQTAREDYFCLIDGDMTLAPEFVEQAIRFLEENPRVAGVGGAVIEHNLDSEEFQIRVAAMAKESHRRPGIVDRLDGGGVYRTAALRALGFFADRNLHSFEEFELSARLHAAGWQLVRLDLPAVHHRGHTASGYRLLLRRLAWGQLDGSGEVLRAALGRDHLGFVLRRLNHLKWGAAIWTWWAALLLAVLFCPVVLAALLMFPVAFLSWRRGSLRLGLFSFCLWNVTAIGILRGLFRSRTPPERPLTFVALSAGRVSS